MTLKLFWDGYMTGVIAAITIMGLFQDFLGKEEYIEYATNHWVSLPWWIWLITFLFFMVRVLTLAGRAREMDRKNGR